MIEEQELPPQEKSPKSNEPTQEDRAPEPSLSAETASEGVTESVDSTADEIRGAKEEIKRHQENGREKTSELAQQSPDILQAENEADLKKSIIEAEMASDPDITKEQAEERYEGFKTQLLAMGSKVVEWFKGGVKNSSFAKLIDFIFFGKNETSSGSTSKESSANTVGQNEFLRELSHQESFAKALGNAYESGEGRLKNLKDFRLSQENLRAAENGDRAAFESLLTELNSIFSSAHGEENWAAFKKVFAESLYPGKTNIELDDSIKDVISQMVKGDKFEQYLGQDEAAQDEDEEKQDE